MLTNSDLTTDLAAVMMPRRHSKQIHCGALIHETAPMLTPTSSREIASSNYKKINFPVFEVVSFGTQFPSVLAWFWSLLRPLTNDNSVQNPTQPSLTRGSSARGHPVFPEPAPRELLGDDCPKPTKKEATLSQLEMCKGDELPH
jgi:hypothetical protein